MDELVVRRWTVDDGLPTESLTGVLQTRDGFLWVISYEGLFRFDGRSFKVFDQQRINDLRAPGSTTTLAADGFYRIVEDPSGALWVAGQGGQVVRHRDGLFDVFDTGVGGVVYGLCVRAQEMLAAGRQVVALGLGDGLTTTPVAELNKVFAASGIEAAACLDGALWLGSGLGEIVEAGADGTLAHYRLPSGQAVEFLAAAHRGDRADGVWAGSRDGLAHVGADGVTPVPELHGVGVYDTAEDQRGDLWLATSRGLARRRSEGFFEWLDTAATGLSEAHALSFDREGNLWVAARRGGLFRLTAPKLRSVTTRDGLRPGSVDAMIETRRGEILVGFDDHLAILDGGGRAAAWPLPPGMGDFDVLALLEDRDGGLWIGSYLGLLRVADGGVRRGVLEDRFPGLQVRALHEDSEGTLWIGTANRGVVALRPDGTTRVLDQASGLLSDFVFSIDPGPDGALLFGVREGFHVLSRDGGLSTFRTGEDLPGSNVFSVVLGAGGHLWLATDAGLTRFDGRTFQSFGEAEGLPTDTIFDLRENLRDDGTAWLWISSSTGVIRVSKDGLNRFFAGTAEASAVKVDLFDEADGMSNRQCSGARRMLQTSDGRLFFPTHDGVTVVEPERLVFNEHVPPVVVDRFLVDGESIRLLDDVAPVLPPGRGRYTFDLAVLSLRDPARNRARYTLEGWDDGWLETGGTDTATYTNLPHGNYVFKVQGANDDGLWNEEGARLAFTVRPFFYETLLFRAAVSGLGLLLAAGLFQWRSRAIRRRNIELQDLSEQRRQLIVTLQRRTKEIDRYLYIFSHDFKNPLLTIRSFAGMIRQDIDNGMLERARTDVDRVTEAAEQITGQLDDLLKFAEIGRMKSSQETFVLADVIRQARDRQAEEISRRGAEVVLGRDAPGVAPIEVFGDRWQVLEAVEELLKNALKFNHLALQPRVEFSMERQDGYALCRVRDNGPGIAPIYHEKVFRPLEQLDPQTPGTGIGLALVSRVVDQHGGRVWIDPSEPGGTTVTFTLPMRGSTG